MTDSKISRQHEGNRFEAFFNYASMGIVVVNEKSHIISVNPFALQLFGYTEAEMVEQPISILIPPRYHHAHHGYHSRYMASPANRPMGMGRDLFAIRKDGTEFPVEISLGNYTSGGNQYVISFINDISLRKQAQHELERLNDELETTVEQRTQELMATMRQLQQSKEDLAILLAKEKELSELKSRFVSMASHEFRTPLSTVLSSAYLVEKYKETQDQPKREKHLQRIISSVNMLTDILNDFLSVGKIEEGKIQVRMADLELPALMGQLVQEMQVNTRKDQRIEYVHQGQPKAYLDPSLLKHIAMNLISNASKFSPEGASIEVGTYADSEGAHLQVKDHGIGISPDDQVHLMERFFRGANAVNIQGTGLGLHIVAKYAELMGGTIHCESELEKGTTFKVIFRSRGVG
jgi:PAS domain S-box-containing protein